MADKKISEFPVDDALSGDLLPVARGDDNFAVTADTIADLVRDDLADDTPGKGASLVSLENGQTVQEAIDAILVRGNSSSITAAYIETISTGLRPSTPANVSATLEVNVSGVAGSAILTTSDTSLVAGFGSTTLRFEVALVSNDGNQMFFATAIGNNGSTQITLLKPLSANFVGVLSPKYDAALGQHLSQNGTRAYAQHVANQTGIMCARGGIMDGAWLDGPASLQTGWSRNAALIAYGVSNSAAPVVASTLSTASAANVLSASGQVVNPTSLASRGVQVGTHAAGHGAAGVFYGHGKDVVLEFWVGADRTTTAIPGAAIAVTVSNNGTQIYSSTETANLSLHRIPIAAAGLIEVSVTNTDGAIYNILISQTTLREAGRDGRLIQPHHKVVCLGDSWFEYYSGLFAATLAEITGATVINRALGGQTTEWALSWFDAYVAAEKPDVCILHFFTNDSNNLSSQTFTTPSGGTSPKWPSGLTDAQSQAHWRGNILKLVQKCQALGIRPVVINAGGTASEAQMQKHANWSWALDKSAPSHWVATFAQLSDTTSFINNYGKRRGSLVSIGDAVRYASGPLSTDAWTNPVDTAFLALQKKTLSRGDYDRTPTFSLGTDVGGDGISDGLVTVPWGTNSTLGETLTLSISSGYQRYSYSFVAGNDGNKRLRWDFSLEAGKEYLVIFEVANGSADFSMDFVENITTGSYAQVSATNRQSSLVGGVGPLWARVTAGATVSNRGVAFAPARTNGVTRTMDVTAAYCIDLAALFVDAPNAASLTNSELVAFVRGLLA